MPGPWPRRLSVLVAPASWAPPARRCGWVESRGVRHRGRNVPGMLGAAYLWPGMFCGIISRQPSCLWNNHPGGVAETPVRLCLPRQPSGVCTEPPVAEAHVCACVCVCVWICMYQCEARACVGASVHVGVDLWVPLSLEVHV